MKSWNNSSQQRLVLWPCRCYSVPPHRNLLQKVTCSKLFTTLLSSLVIFDPHLQWFLKLASEYSKLTPSNLLIQPTSTSLLGAVQIWSAHPGVFSAQPGKVWVFCSQKNSRFKYNANWQPKVLGSGSGSQGLLSHRDVLASYLLSHKCHLQLQEHRATNQGNRPETVPTESTYSRENNESGQISVPWKRELTNRITSSALLESIKSVIKILGTEVNHFNFFL